MSDEKKEMKENQLNDVSGGLSAEDIELIFENEDGKEHKARIGIRSGGGGSIRNNNDNNNALM